MRLPSEYYNYDYWLHQQLEPDDRPRHTPRPTKRKATWQAVQEIYSGETLEERHARLEMEAEWMRWTSLSDEEKNEIKDRQVLETQAYFNNNK